VVKKGRKRGVHRQRRPRRPLPGMMLHLDGSKHRWFQDERWYDLIVVMDDATSEIYYAQLVEEESTRTVMAALREVTDLDQVFSIQHERVVNRDNTVSWAHRALQIEKTSWRGTLAGCRVIVCEHLDGRLSILYGPHRVGLYTAQGVALVSARRQRGPSRTLPLPISAPGSALGLLPSMALPSAQARLSL
jgi:hypothetical protein